MAQPGGQSDNGTLQVIDKLQTIFHDGYLYQEIFLGYKGTDAQSLLDGFQWLLNRPECESNIDFRRHLVVATQRLAKRSQSYPTCYELKSIILNDEDPVGGGGFADIYKGNFEGRAVCLKSIRTYQSSQARDLLKQITHESILWGQLEHENVLPFYGLYIFKNRVCFVSPWMEAGDVRTYLKNHPEADRRQLVVDVAKGLRYLHENEIVHGDLKGPNILIDDAGRAQLTDFGISAMSVPEITGLVSTSSAASKGGSVRWQAPELFDVVNDDAVKNSQESDVYAFSCVCYEIFTSTAPFDNLKRESTIGFHVMNGARPGRPPDNSSSWQEWGLTTPIWTLMEECWLPNPNNRPKLPQIIDRLQEMTTTGHLPEQKIPKMSSNRFRQRLEEVMNPKDVFISLDSILNRIVQTRHPPTKIETIMPQQVTDICTRESMSDTRKRPKRKSSLSIRGTPSTVSDNRIRFPTDRTERLEMRFSEMGGRFVTGGRDQVL